MRKKKILIPCIAIFTCVVLGAGVLTYQYSGTNVKADQANDKVVSTKSPIPSEAPTIAQTLEPIVQTPEPTIITTRPTVEPSQYFKDANGKLNLKQDKSATEFFNPQDYYSKEITKVVIDDNEMPTITFKDSDIIKDFKKCITGKMTGQSIDSCIGCNFTVSFYAKDQLVFSIRYGLENAFYVIADNVDGSFVSDQFTYHDLQMLTYKYSKAYQEYYDSASD